MKLFWKEDAERLYYLLDGKIYCLLHTLNDEPWRWVITEWPEIDERFEYIGEITADYDPEYFE